MNITQHSIMIPNEEKSRQKKQFYDDLDALHNDRDPDPDPGRKSSEQAWKSSRKAPTAPSKAAVPRTSLARSVSDITADASSRQPVDDGSVRPAATDPSTQLPNKTKVSMLTKSMSDLPHSSVSRRMTGKRKRESMVGLLPERQQIFRDLHFFFFPNNNSNPARRMRISKSQQYGATWEQEWSDQVTHVILDKAITFADLLKFLKLDLLPDTVVVVSEDYPAECLSYKALLDPKQGRFACKGFTPPTLLRTESTNSTKSLQLKTDRKTQARQERETPSDQTNVAVAASGLPPKYGPLREVRDNAESIFTSFQGHSTASNREFEEVIQKAKALEHVPLDDDEGDSRPSSAAGPESGDEGKKAGLRLLNQRKGKFRNAQDKFQCMQKHTGDEQSNNPNQPTMDILQQMADYYDQTGDEWRPRAYRKAISTLRTQNTKICTKEQAAALPNIGGRLAEKIEEIAMTSRLRRLDSAKAEPADATLQTFMGVYGAGVVKATQWVDQGYKTLDELLERAELTENQRMGIEHYEDFNSRIPREEVERHGNIVRGALHDIDPAFRLIVGGSYRRGSKDSGDIDCIITRPDTGADHLRNVVLGQLVPRLTKQGFLVANLAITSRDDGSKWHGASCLPGFKTWRRLDMLLVPSDELGAALIYFTGNDIFNRSLRLLAATKGMRLNQRGLYRDVLRGPQRARLTEGTLVEGKDEKKIFEALGVPWRPPEHRIC